MTKAKYLHGTNRSGFVRKSFENKIAHMERVYAVWMKARKQGVEYWPSTLAELKRWDDPENEIFEWSSNNVTVRESTKYGDLVERFRELQEGVSAIPRNDDDGPELQRLKSENILLATQVAMLLWQIGDCRDEVIRLDPSADLLKTTVFPPEMPKGRVVLEILEKALRLYASP